MTRFNGYDNMMWKKVNGTEDVFVNSDGVIRKGNTILTQHKTTEGYLRCSYNGKREYVHRIVAKTFIPNPMHKQFVDHIDGDPSNNNVSNLRWVTAHENSIAAAARGAFHSGPISRPIVAIDVTTNEVFARYNSQAEAAADLGLHDASINKCLKNKRFSVHGYSFSYIGRNTLLNGGE